MNLPPLQAHVLAYFLSHGGRDFSMVGRWWPHAELALVMADKIRIAVRPFGKAAQDAATPVAEALSEHMLSCGGFSTKAQKFECVTEASCCCGDRVQRLAWHVK